MILNGVHFDDLADITSTQLSVGEIARTPDGDYERVSSSGQLDYTGSGGVQFSETGQRFTTLSRFRAAIARLYDHMGTVKFTCEDAYEWVCEQAGITTFVADQWAWDCFYNVYDSALGLDD